MKPVECCRQTAIVKEESGKYILVFPDGRRKEIDGECSYTCGHCNRTIKITISEGEIKVEKKWPSGKA